MLEFLFGWAAMTGGLMAVVILVLALGLLAWFVGCYLVFGHGVLWTMLIEGKGGKWVPHRVVALCLAYAGILSLGLIHWSLICVGIMVLPLGVVGAVEIGLIRLIDYY